MIYYTLEAIILGLVVIIIVMGTMLAEERDNRRQREAWNKHFTAELLKRSQEQ